MLESITAQKMNLSELALKLILILIPGILCALVIEKLTVHKPWSAFKFGIHSITTGALTYLIFQILQNIPIYLRNLGSDCQKRYETLSIWTNLTNTKNIPYDEIAYGCLTSLFLGFFASAFVQFKVLNRTAQFLGITTKYGDENLYSYFLNSPITDEVYLRDLETGLTYHGLVESYSEDEKNKEIVLTKVTIFDSDSGDELYDLEKIYIGKSEENLIIELPYKNLEEE